MTPTKFQLMFATRYILPEEVNRTQSNVDSSSNQSNLIEHNRSIGFRLYSAIEHQSNFYIFFTIGSIDSTFDCIRLPFDYV